MADEVHAPNHYCKGGVECIDAIKSSMTPEAFAGFCKGNVIKYVFRYENKGGVQDLQKAGVYLEWLMQTAAAIEFDREQSTEW